MVMEEGASGGDAPGRNAGAFVQALLDLRDTYNRFLVESFSSDQQFKNAIASVSSIYIQSISQIFTCWLPMRLVVLCMPSIILQMTVFNICRINFN